MQTIKIILLLLAITLTSYANIPPQTTYNENNQPLVIEYEDGSSILYEYDGEGKLLSVETTYADGTTVQESKNISGLPSAKVDEAGQRTQYGYDITRSMPVLNQVTLANNAVTQYTYDSQGKKLSQSDALSHTTSWSYKPTGELASETLPQGETKNFTYDSYGKQTQVNDYAHKAQKFIYDSYDRLVRIELADGSTTTYAYTPSGRVKTITDAQGTIANTYDEMGRLKTQTSPSNETITYSYDGVGNIVEIVTPQTTISKTYDALNRLKTVTDAQGTVTYTYDGIGRQTQVAYSNGMTTSYEYDSRNRMTSIVHKKSDGTVLQSFNYTLDAVGNRTRIVEHTARTVDYTYNTVHQLTQEVVSNDPNGVNTTTSFTYDTVGNMLTKTIDGVDTSYAYNDNDQLTTQGSVTFTYDDNGNLVAKDDTTYTYDDKNRLIKTTTPNNTIEYSYDANDNRIAKTTNDGTTTYLIDANTAYAQVITESKEDGTEVNYTHGNDLLSDGTHSFLTDALGSTRGLVNNSESLTDSYAYTPYGELVNHDGNSTNGFLFTGEQFDEESGEYYLRARYYSPSSGRFLNRDTYDGRMVEPITLNHYLYGNGNPLTYVDPTGHFSMAGSISAMNTMATLSTAFTFGYNLGDMFYGGGAPLPSLDEATAKQIAFAVMFSSAGGKVLGRIFKNKKFKKLTKKITLLRGVNSHNIGYSDAVKGQVNGNYFDFFRPSTYSSDTALAHNSGATYGTPFSSWTKNFKVAKNFATRGGGGGIVIRAKIMAFRIFKSPNIEKVLINKKWISEGEWLVVGPVQGIPVPVR